MEKPKTSRGFKTGESRLICPVCKGGKVNPISGLECKHCKGSGYSKIPLPQTKFTQKGRK